MSTELSTVTLQNKAISSRNRGEKDKHSNTPYKKEVDMARSHGWLMDDGARKSKRDVGLPGFLLAIFVVIVVLAIVLWPVAENLFRNR